MYWIPDEEQCWICATFVEETSKKGVSRFVLPNGRAVDIKSDNCVPILNPLSLQDAPDDLISLSEVNEATILNAINIRFSQEKIYTACGSVLMVMNPFAAIENLYGDAQIAYYSDPFSEGLTPHIYLISSRAYSLMCSTQRNQSILISGESGAGKTESTKQCLSLLTKIAQSSVKSKASASDALGGSAQADVGQRIIAASPILEAFGNAQTVRNPNSSRFGKWMELNFDKDNKITGSTIISYLLEKSRLTNRDAKLERNYHIFYQILRGQSVEELQQWSLVPETYHYSILCREHGVEAPNLKDVQCYEETMNAFEDMGFSKEIVMDIIRIVAAILHLGNVEVNSERSGEASSVKAFPDERPGCCNCAALLGVDNDMLSYSMCNRTMQSGSARKSVTVINLNPERACDSRDSLSRAIYDKLFLEMVNVININNKTAVGAGVRSLGLLDIFGFEIFIENSLEQLCINYCNEILQNYFNYVIFTAEKELYLREGIVCDTIMFKDNLPIMTDIESSFKALDEESKIPKGSSKTWFDKLKKLGPAKLPNISFPTSSKDVFTVMHYAGVVVYNPISFMEKNVESLNNDLVNVMMGSSVSLVRRLFSDAPEAPASSTTPNRAGSISSSKAGATAGASGGSSSSSGGNKSIAFKFQAQLQSLMTMLRATESHFVRCIKSNSKCRPMLYEPSLVQKQLLYSGVFEVVKIQQSGLPIRKPHDLFISRFRCLLPSTVRYNCKTSVQMISSLLQHGYDLPNIQSGKKMTFYKGYEERILENKRNIINAHNAIKLQAFWKYRIRRYLYGRILLLRKEIFGEIVVYNIQSCKSKFTQLSSFSAYFSRISGFGILEHVDKDVNDKINYLEDQLLAVKQAEELSMQQSETALDQLCVLLPMWDRLCISNHQAIVRCTDLIQRYSQAKAFVASFSGVVSPDIKPVDDLTVGDISLGMEILSPFKGFLSGAVKCLRTAETRKVAIKKEFEELSANIVNAINYEMVNVDDFGGITFGPKPGSTLKKPLKSLENAIKAIATSQLISKDAKNLVHDCSKLIMIRNELIPQKKYQEVIDVVSVFLSSEQAVIDQSRALTNWATAKMMSMQLELCLKSGQIQIGDVGIDFSVDVDILRQQTEQLALYEFLSKFVANFLEIARCILQLRASLVNNDWQTFERVLIESKAIAPLQKLPDCMQEIESARWQLKCHSFEVSLLSICSRKVFAGINPSLLDWSSILDDLRTDETKHKAASEFSTQYSAVASINELVGAVDTILKLRKSMGNKQFQNARSQFVILKSQYVTVFSTHGLMDTFNSELAICLYLIEALELEKHLEDALLAVPPCPDDAFSREPSLVQQLLSSTKEIATAAKKCSSIREPSSILSLRLVVANIITQGRELLSCQSVSDCLATNWSTKLTQHRQSGAGIAINIGNCKSEYSAVLKEIERRSIFWDFAGILLSTVVTGTVGKINFNHTNNTDFSQEEFKKITVRLNQSQASLPGTIYQELVLLRQCCSDLMAVRSALFEKKWDDAESISKDKFSLLNDSYSNSPYGGLIEFLSSSSKILIEELKLCSTECNFQLALQKLKDAVHKIDVKISADGIVEVTTISTEAIKKCNLTLHKFSSTNPEAMLLLKLSSNLIALLGPCMKTPIFNIATEEMVVQLQYYSELKLDSTILRQIISFLQMQQYLGIFQSAVGPSLTTADRDRSLSLLMMKMSAPSSISPDAANLIRLFRMYSALEIGVESEDWLLVEEVAESMQLELEKIVFRTSLEVKVKNFFQQKCESRELLARKVGTKAHLDVVLSAGPMKASAGGLGLSVPSQGTAIIEGFLEVSAQDRKQYSELNKMFSEVDSLLAVRKKAVRLISEGWETVVRSENNGSIPDLKPNANYKKDRSIANEEANILSKAIYFGELAQELEACVLNDVVSWNEIRKAPSINNNIYDKQIGVVRKILETFPNAIEDSALLKVLSAFHSLLSSRLSKISTGAASSPRANARPGGGGFKVGPMNDMILDTDEPVVDDIALQKVRHLLNIVSIPAECSKILNRQVILLEKGSLLYEMKQLVITGQEYFVSKNYSKDLFHTLVTKLGNLGAATEADMGLHEEWSAAIKCLSLARDVCWASNMQLPDECESFTKKLRVDIVKTSGLFRKLASEWLNTLPVLRPLEIGINLAQRQAGQLVVDGKPIDINSLVEYPECIAFISATGTYPPAFDKILMSSVFRYFMKMVKSLVEVIPNSQRSTMQSLSMLFNIIPFNVDDLALSNMIEFCTNLIRQLKNQQSQYTGVVTTLTEIFKLVQQFKEEQHKAEIESSSAISTLGDAQIVIGIRMLSLVREILQTPPPGMSADADDNYVERISVFINELLSFRCLLGLTRGGINLAAFNPYSLSPWLEANQLQSSREHILQLLDDNRDDPRMLESSADLKFLLELLENVTSDQFHIDGTEQAETALKTVDAIRLVSRGFELDTIYLPHRLFADYLHRWIYSLHVIKQETNIRTQLLEFLEASSTSRTGLDQEIEKTIRSIHSKALLRDISPSFEGLLLWKLIMKSDLVKGSCSKILVDIAPYYKLSEDTECRVDKIIQCVGKIEDNRNLLQQITMFLRNRRQNNLTVSETVLTTKSPAIQNLISALKRCRSIDHQHPVVSSEDVIAICSMTGHEDSMSVNLHNLILQELALMLQRVEEGKSEDFFYTLTQSIKSRVLSIATVGSFFATPEIVQLHQDSKTLYSSLLKVLWKDSESLCLLCDLVTTKDPNLAPFEVKRVMNLLETDSNEFSSMASEAELLGTLKFHFWRVLESITSDDHMSFNDLEIPSFPDIAESTTPGSSGSVRILQLKQLVEIFQNLVSLRQRFEEIRDQCLQNENYADTLREAKLLLNACKEFLPSLRESPETLPDWLVSAEALRAGINKIASECEKVMIICEDELFRSTLSDAMNISTSTNVMLSLTEGNNSPLNSPSREQDELLIALGDYLLSRTLLLMANNQKPVLSSAVALPVEYSHSKSRRVPKDGLIYRANLLRLLREAIKNDEWLTAEPIRKPVPSPAAEPAKRRMSTYQSVEPGKRRMSLNYIPPSSQALAENDPAQLTSVQAIVQQWFATVENPDIWEGSAEFKSAYDEVRNRILFDLLIKHASVGKSYDPSKVLQVVYTDAGYSRPANVNSVISRLDLHLDLQAIERTQALWALEIMSKSGIANIIHTHGIENKLRLSPGSTQAGELENPSESVQVVVELYNKMLQAYQVAEKLAFARCNSDDIVQSSRDQFVAVAMKAGAIDSKSPLEAIDLLVEQLQLIPRVGSQDYVGLLSAVQNWAQWTDEDWEMLSISPQTKMIVAKNRAVVAANRRVAMIRNFMAFYAHEAADIYLNLADMQLSTFGDSAENSWQDRGMVIRSKLSGCFHIDKYFQEMVDIQKSGGLSISSLANNKDGGHPDLDEMKKLADCQLFHLQQALDAEPKCRTIMSCAQTLKRIKDKMVHDSWQANRSELKAVMQTHVSNELWQILSDTCFAVDAEITLQKVEDEIDREIDISKCTCRFEIANVLSQAVVRVSNLSLAAVGFYEQQSLLRLSNADDATISPRLLEVIEWTLNMRLAILSEDWRMVELLEDMHKQKERSMAQYCLFGSQSLCKLANIVMKHSSALERLHTELGGGVQMAVGGEVDDDAPYFHFIDANSLQFAVDNSNVELSTEELQSLLKAARFTLELMLSIEADYWFDSSRIQDQASHLNDVDALHRRSVFQGNEKRTPEMVSVSELLQAEKPGKYCPKAILVEVDRVEREFQNQQVEVRLVQALQNGRDYLRQTENFEDISTDELQEVVDIASSLRVRSLRNSKLFDAATKILHLRHAVKSGDWVAIRYCLSEAAKSTIVPEAEYELKELMLISEERNHRMHVMISEAIRLNRVGGTFMRLDGTKVDAMLLLSALRSSINVPKISHEDKQLIYTAEKLKNIRISILMMDYERLVVETSATDLTMICSEGLEEMLLVKKAIDFFQNIKEVNLHLLNGGCVGTPGLLDTQNLSIYQLSNSLAAFHLSDCEDSVKQFLCCGMVMRDLRAATKGSRWGTLELSNLLIDYVLQQRIKKLEEASLKSRRKSQAVSLDDSRLTALPSSSSQNSLASSGGRKRSMTSAPALQSPGSNNSTPFYKAAPASPNGPSDACTADHIPMKVISFDYQSEMFGNVLLTNKASFGIRYESESGYAAKSNQSKFDSDVNDGNDGQPDMYNAYPYEIGHGIASNSGPLRGVAPYKDIPGSDIFILDMMNHPSLDPMSVPRLLASMSFVIDAVEREVVLLRDEVYNRITATVLRRGLSYQSLFTEAMNYGDDLEAAEGGAVDLDAAIEVASLLGCKSKESLRLLHTALFVRDLRVSVASKAAKQTLELLGSVWAMKSNNLFDPIAVAEVDDVFHSVCSVNLKNEIYAKLLITDEAASRGALTNDDSEPLQDADADANPGFSRSIDVSSLKKSMRKIASFKNPDTEASQILTLCSTYLAVRDASRCGVISRMEDSIYRARSHLQSVAVTEAARQFPRLRILMEMIQSEMEKITLEVNDLSHTIRSDGIGASDSNKQTLTASTVQYSTTNYIDVGDADDERVLTRKENEEETLTNLVAVNHEPTTEAHGITYYCHQIFNTVQGAIANRADDDNVAVQIGGKFDSLLKEILSNEQPEFQCGDLDSTVLRVVCTLLLISLYLGQPTADRETTMTPGEAYVQRIRREKHPEESDVVIIDMKVEILRKANNIVLLLLDEIHVQQNAYQDKIRQETTARYFSQRTLQTKSTPSNLANLPDVLVNPIEITPSMRCQTEAVSRIGAQFAELLPVVIQSPRHAVEIDNSLMMLKTLVKSNAQSKLPTTALASGVIVLNFLLRMMRRIGSSSGKVMIKQ